MGSKGNFDDLAWASSAGASSGDGGGGGGGDAAPPSPPHASPSSDPSALAASPPLLQPPGPPPRAADDDEDMDEVPDDEEEDDGYWNWEQEEAEYHWGGLEEGEIEDDGDSGDQERDDQDWGENLRGSSDNEFFSILFMSDRRNVPDDIIRNGFDSLNKHEYFSRRQFSNGGSRREDQAMAIPLAMAGAATPQAPDRTMAVSDEMVRRQASEAEAEGPPLEGGGDSHLLPWRRSRRLLHLWAAATSNLLPSPLRRHRDLRDVHRREVRGELGRGRRQEDLRCTSFSNRSNGGGGSHICCTSSRINGGSSYLRGRSGRRGA